MARSSGRIGNTVTSVTVTRASSSSSSSKPTVGASRNVGGITQGVTSIQRGGDTIWTASGGYVTGTYKTPSGVVYTDVKRSAEDVAVTTPVKKETVGEYGQWINPLTGHGYSGKKQFEGDVSSEEYYRTQTTRQTIAAGVSPFGARIGTTEIQKIEKERQKSQQESTASHRASTRDARLVGTEAVRSSTTTQPSQDMVTRLPDKGKVETFFERAEYMQSKSERERNIPRAGLYAGVAVVGGFVNPLVSDVKSIVKSPTQFVYGEIISTVVGSYQLLKSPYDIYKGNESALELYGEQFKKNPYTSIGSISYEFLKGKSISKFGIVAKEKAITFGSKYVEPESVFDPKVLSGTQKFPTSKSPEESIGKFKSAKEVQIVTQKTSNVGEPTLIYKTKETTLTAIHSSPQSLPRTANIKAGERGAKLVEDPGLYIAPKGQGSPYFLKVTPETKYTFLEKQAMRLSGDTSSVKDILKSPTITEVSYRAIKRQPERIIRSKGFEESSKFLESQRGSGTVFITKRSEIGQRGLKGLGGGTTETEAIVPVGSQLKLASSKSILGRLKGFEDYTIIKGKPIAIKKYKLVEGSPSSSIKSTRNIAKDQKYIESYYSQSYKPTSPLTYSIKYSSIYKSNKTDYNINDSSTTPYIQTTSKSERLSEYKYPTPKTTYKTPSIKYSTPAGRYSKPIPEGSYPKPRDDTTDKYKITTPDAYKIPETGRYRTSTTDRYRLTTTKIDKRKIKIPDPQPRPKIESKFKPKKEVIKYKPRKAEYTPSVWAISERITGSKKRGEEGISIRPLILKTKSKTKRRSKR